MNTDTNPAPTSGASQAGQPPAFPLAAGSVQGFWRSARGENHGRNSQPGDVWVEPGDITDSDRLRWLHTGGGRDANGYEWGVFRVKWDERGQPIEVWQTNSDLSDLDAEILRESAASQNTPVTDAEPETPANTRAQSPRSV